MSRILGEVLDANKRYILATAVGVAKATQEDDSVQHQEC